MLFYIILFAVSMLGLFIGAYHGVYLLSKPPKTEKVKPEHGPSGTKKKKSPVSRAKKCFAKISNSMQTKLHKKEQGNEEPQAVKAPDEDVAEIVDDTENNNSHNNTLFERLPQNAVTLSEFDCAADGIDYDEYLLRKRSEEETAYHVMQMQEAFPAEQGTIAIDAMNQAGAAQF